MKYSIKSKHWPYTKTIKMTVKEVMTQINLRERSEESQIHIYDKFIFNYPKNYGFSV